MSNLRILQVQETNWVERNVIQPHNILERLVQRGHYVQIIDYDILWESKNEDSLIQARKVFPEVNRVILGVNVKVTRPSIVSLPLACHASYAITSLIELQHMIIKEKPDVVIGYSLTNSYPMAWLLRNSGIPFLYMVLEPYHTMMPYAWLRPIARVFESAAERLASRCLIFTPQMRQYLLRMGVNEDHIVEFHSGADLEALRTDNNRDEQRANLGLSSDRWVLFFMGWLYDFSGMREITQAIAQNPKIIDDACLLIVGDGDIFDELRQLVKRNGLEEKIILTGKRPYSEIPSYLAVADVCLLPSLENDITREIVPQKVFEYLAAGKPVVASPLPGLLAEFGSENGIIYADRPEDTLQRAIDLAKEPRIADQLGRAGRRFAERNCDWDKITDLFEELLLSLVEA